MVLELEEIGVVGTLEHKLVRDFLPIGKLGVGPGPPQGLVLSDNVNKIVVKNRVEKAARTERVIVFSNPIFSVG